MDDTASRRQMHHRSPGRGFTLPEVMITLLIVAILAGIALPEYKSYLVRSALMEGQSALSQARVAMEQYFQDNRRYSSGEKACGASAAGTTNFTFTCEAPTRTTYTLTASGKEGTRAAGYTYTVNESDQRTTTSFNGQAVSSACWLTRSTSDC